MHTYSHTEIVYELPLLTRIASLSGFFSTIIMHDEHGDLLLIIWLSTEH